MCGEKRGHLKLKRILKRTIVGTIIGAAALAAGLFGLRWWTHRAYRERVYQNIAEVPGADAEDRVAIVFGAGLWSGGDEPSPVLYDRVATAAELYRTGRARKLLVTGDNRFLNYNEPAVMRRTAIGLGVPTEDIVMDYAGRRTYDSCYRAQAIYGVRRAVLVTQAFHLDRAMLLCESLGVQSIGVSADRRGYGDGAQRWWNFREVLATAGAYGDLYVFRPQPILGDPIPIEE